MKPQPGDQIVKINNHDIFVNDLYRKDVRKITCKSDQFAEIVFTHNAINPIVIHTLFCQNFNNLSDIEIVEIIN